MPSKRCTASIIRREAGSGLLGRFRIQALDEPGGVLDVGKDGDLFTLHAFQGGAGGEDFVGG